MASRLPVTNIRETVYGILRDHMPGYSGPIEPELKLDSDLGLDSLEFYQLVGDVEEGLGFRGDERDLLNIVTVGDLVGYAERQSNPG